MSKTVEFSRVTPFLFGMSPTDLKGPLVQFQACVFTEKDVGRLVSSLNDACGEERLETARLDRSLAMWWPALKEALDEILKSEGRETEPSPGVSRPLPDIVAEILELARSQQKMLGDAVVLRNPDALEREMRPGETWYPPSLEALLGSQLATGRMYPGQTYPPPLGGHRASSQGYPAPPSRPSPAPLDRPENAGDPPE